ncbi:hypothetical protein D3C81_1500560 [compost metagenome]
MRVLSHDMTILSKTLVRTTQPGIDVSLVELIRFQCGRKRYTTLRRYQRTSSGSYQKRVALGAEGTAQPNSQSESFVNNVCIQVAHIAGELAAGHADPVPLKAPSSPSCDRHHLSD